MEKAINRYQIAEMDGMPVTGWSIDATTNHCACKLYWKEKRCVHVTAYLIHNRIEIPNLWKPPAAVLTNQYGTRPAGRSRRNKGALRLWLKNKSIPFQFLCLIVVVWLLLRMIYWTFLPQVVFDILVLCLSYMSTTFHPLKAISSEFGVLGGLGRKNGWFWKKTWVAFVFSRILPLRPETGTS